MYMSLTASFVAALCQYHACHIVNRWTDVRNTVVKTGVEIDLIIALLLHDRIFIFIEEIVLENGADTGQVHEQDKR